MDASRDTGKAWNNRYDFTEGRNEGTPGWLLLPSPVVVVAGETAVVGGGERQRYQHPRQTGLG